MELPNIGQTCVICNRNDYLPFKCAHCYKWVCIDHRSNHGSDCPLARTTFEANTGLGPSSESLRQSCDFCNKITLKLELSECPHCSANHCLYHRHQVQHSCHKLAEYEEIRRREQLARTERQQEVLERLKATQQTSTQNKPPSTYRAPQVKTTDPKKLALARRVRVMRIKQSARGPPNVLDKDKLFFEVEFAHESKSNLSNEAKHGKKVSIFATAKHTIGRLVDWSADELDITNKNHVDSSDQLVFKRQPEDSSEAVVLDNQGTFQKYLESGLLDSGDQLTITYLSSPS